MADKSKFISLMSLAVNDMKLNFKPGLTTKNEQALQKMKDFNWIWHLTKAQVDEFFLIVTTGLERDLGKTLCFLKYEFIKPNFLGYGDYKIMNFTKQLFKNGFYRHWPEGQFPDSEQYFVDKFYGLFESIVKNDVKRELPQYLK